MLNDIKAMILEKQNELDTIELLSEETKLHNFDESIILTESELVEPVFEEDEDNEDEEESKETDVTDSEDDDDDKDDSDILDKNIDDDEAEVDSDNDGVDDSVDDTEDISDAPIDEPEAPVEDDVPEVPQNDIGNDSIEDDDLPEPVGAQTGEPISDDNDLLSTEIDLGSNTMKDTLPVPPNNAADVVDGDEQRIDSGFGNDELPPEEQDNDVAVKLQQLIDNTNNSSIRVDELKSLLHESSMFEAISIGNENIEGDNNDNKEEKEVSEDKPDDEVPPDDNLVTQAVKDKVAESEVSDDMSDGNDAAPSDSNAVKDNLFKKLSKLTKDIEDAKNQIIENM